MTFPPAPGPQLNELDVLKSLFQPLWKKTIDLLGANSRVQPYRHQAQNETYPSSNF